MVGPYDGAFVPGTLLAERYRIVGLLGRGGMGEVYRADDLVLGQAVALKFLPPTVEQDPQRLQRFVAEVSAARQVAHPNVCRVYDIGTIAGKHFYSMEYIDGEDLSSLLRRIGRLPSDKGLEIARQLCAALGAVHDKGLLHCDLKPSNVMLDGRGKVRLTDFGLAAAAAGDAARGGIAGTPAYMAPEQLGGAPPSVQSDLYALGLVLYEVFTGRRLFEAPTIAELKAKQERFQPDDLTSTTVDIDPAVERAISRCLDKAPSNRPTSPFAVAAALPGGDPLAAALAAGETPSPDLVAAAGERGGLDARTAWFVLALLVLAAVALFAVRHQTSLAAAGSLGLAPDVLANKAQEMLVRLGYDQPPVDTAHGFSWDEGYVTHVRNTDRSPTRWRLLAGDRGLALGFWHRTSPQYLFAGRWVGGPGIVPGRVRRTDPPFDQSGMTLVMLDPGGRLRELRVVPARLEPDPGAPSPPFDWARLFQEAGLDMSTFSPRAPRWVPPSWADARAAWSGPLPSEPSISVDVEAAAWRGKPVFFVVAGPWTRPSGDAAAQRSPGRRSQDIVSITVVVSVLLGAALLARRNMKLGRGDRRGAARLGLAVVLLVVLSWLFAGSHVPAIEELPLFFLALSSALFSGALVWVVYMALEPQVRRRWPHALITWARVLANRGADALVGRDVLFGATMGVLLALVFDLQLLALRGLAAVPPQPRVPRFDALVGLGAAVSALLGIVAEAVLAGLLIFLMLFFLKALLRKMWLAGAALVIVVTAMNVLTSEFPLVDGVFTAAVFSAMCWVLVRFGLVAFVVAQVVDLTLESLPLTLNVGTWYGWSTPVAVVVVCLIAAYGLRAALAGRSLFGADARA